MKKKQSNIAFAYAAMLAAFFLLFYTLDKGFGLHYDPNPHYLNAPEEDTHGAADHSKAMDTPEKITPVEENSHQQPDSTSTAEPTAFVKLRMFDLVA